MNLIARYLLAEVAAAAGLVFLALILLFSFFDLANELGSVGRAGYGFGQALLFVALNIPGHVNEIVPIAALIGSLFALSRLVMNSEFAVMLASGVSGWRIAQLLALAGFAFAMFSLGIGELVSPRTEQAAQRLKLSATESVVAQAFRSGLWVKDGKAFINVQEVLPDSTLRNLKVYEFGQNLQLNRVLTAENGVWQGQGIWRLSGVSDTLFSESGIKVTQVKDRNWRSVLGPDMLSVLLIAPEKMSVPTLLSYIRHLRENRQQTMRYEVALWSKLFYSLAVPVIMLLALPFAFHSPRAGSITTKIFLGILAGLAFHLCNRLFLHVGMLNNWPPFFTASAPSLLFLGVSLYAIKRMERR
jgi:lipopolysaccharide export system permease protein